MKLREDIKPTDPDHLYSEYMEKFYSESPDPWNNKGKYVKWFEGVTDIFPLDNMKGKSIQLIDIGCGGGNVLEGLIHQFKDIASELKVTGCDISQSTIDYLNQDERFTEYLSEPFLCKSITDDDFKVQVNDRADYTIYSMVDVLYYIRSFDWHAVASKIMDQIPVGSFILVADSLRRTEYRRFFSKKYETESIHIPLLVGDGRSIDTVSEEKTESGKIFRRWLNWSVYRKI